MKLDEMTIGYMAISYSHERQLEMYRSFELLDLFGMKYYEDDFITLLTRTDIDGMERQDAFEGLVRTKIVEVIHAHEIFVTDDILLKDANEVLSAIYILQTLEDYSWVQYRLSSLQPNTVIVADILSHVSTYEPHQFARLIPMVSDNFMRLLRAVVDARVTEETYDPDGNHDKMIKNLFSFCNNHPTMGGALLTEGLNINLTLKQLLDIAPYDVAATISEEAVKNPIQAALDIVTFIMIGKDTYQVPVVSYKRYSSLFLNDTLLVTRLEPIVSKIIIDANNHYELKNSNLITKPPESKLAEGDKK